jgi:hypothetical protein
MAKKVQYTTNQPSSSTDYLAADNTWKPYSGGSGGSGIPHGFTSGTNTYTTTISGVTSLSDGDAFLIRFVTGNTTSCTLNINSLGAKTLYRNNDGALIGGDIVDGAEMLCVYNSTSNSFQVIGTAPNTLLSYVTNAESTTITKGQAVYAFGGTGDRLKVKLAYNTSDATSAQTIGIVLSSSIGANQKGLIIMQGQIDGLSLFPTSTWADGDAVYLGATAGSFSKTKPLAPNHLVYLGFVTTASNGSAGRMYVRVQNGYEMDELHNVSAVSPNNNDGLFYNTSTSLWETKQIGTVLGYTPENVTNKKTTMTGNETSNIFYLSAKAIYDWAIGTFQTIITGAASTIVSSNLTNFRVLVSDGGGKVAASGVTGTELGYLSGVTSSIQSQLNAKIGNSVSFWGFNLASSIAASTTTWVSIGVLNGILETTSNYVIPAACTISDMYLIHYVNGQPATGSQVITVRKNGVDTALVITIAAGSAATPNSNYYNSSSVSFAAGDRISIRRVNNATSVSGSINGISLKVTV